MKKYKPIKFSEDFVFDDNKLDYVFKVKKRSYLWLWLLLVALFFGLCCVRCNHDITVHVVDHVTQEPITPTSVTLEYTEHALCKGGSIFYSNAYSQTLETDENGDVVFEDMPCSVFSYIFYAFSDAYLTAENDCNYLKDAPSTCIFHYTWNTTLKLQPKTEDVQVLVTDMETDEPLAGAIVHYNFSLSGQAITDSCKTDAAGKITIVGAPRCGNIQLERVSCYGYEDAVNVELPAVTAVQNPTGATVSLEPKKDSFKFRVINKNTKQAIPLASVVVMLTTNNGQTKRSPQIPTNVSGEGRGESNEAFVLSMVSIHASKDHYRDTTLVTGLTLEKYRDLPEEKRVVELEPLPYEQVFQNVDSITGQPIVGVMNVYTISGNGRTAPKDSIMSNNPDGKFSIWAMEDDHIVIDSKLHPNYKPKHTDIPKFEKGEKIPMSPNYVSLTFRTIMGEKGPLLPDCALQIKTSLSNVTSPTNSGNGIFSVDNIFPFEKISIIASKQGYDVNDYTIYDYLVSDLLYAPEEWRDIPLETDMLPCDGGIPLNKSKGGDFSTRTYNMGKQSGSTTISLDFCSAADKITVYDGASTDGRIIHPTTSYTDKHVIRVNFTQGCITVVIDGTTPAWEYTVNCPD